MSERLSRFGRVLLIGIALSIGFGDDATAATAQSEAGAAQSEAARATVLVEVSDESGTPAAAEMVVLQINDGEQIIDEIVGESAASGAVLFENVPASAGHIAVAFAVYNGYTYRGEETALEAGASFTVPIAVYTAADEGAELHIDVLHIVLTAAAPGLYQAVQVMQVLNVNEQAYFGGPEFDGQRSGLTIPFPPGAVNVAPLQDIGGLDASRLLVDGARLHDLRALPPGTHQLAISYELVTGGEGADFVLTLPYPTADVSILLGPDGETALLESDDLLQQTPQEIPGQGVYANWTSGVVDAGESVSFHLGASTTPISTEAWSLLGLAVALLLTTAASVLGDRLPQPDQGARQDLIAEIAALDDEHAGGGISDLDYHTRRSHVLERLLEADRRAGTTPAPRD